MKCGAGVIEIAKACISLEEPAEKLQKVPKKLAVVRGRVNLSFYEDDTLTPYGKRILTRSLRHDNKP
ncbi:hypothetical protein ES702_03105 [subsurface metagenome]